MLRMKSFVLLMLALFLCSAVAMAEEEKGSSSLPGLIADGAVAGAKGVATGAEAVYHGSHYVLKKGACDGSRAGLNGTRDGIVWFAHETPMDHARRGGRFGKWTLGQAAKTPGRLASGLGWVTGLKIGKR